MGNRREWLRWLEFELEQHYQHERARAAVRRAKGCRGRRRSDRSRAPGKSSFSALVTEFFASDAAGESGFPKMNSATHADHGNPSDPHAGHKMTDDQGSHDRHAGHSVAMFRDKFWLSFALTIPVAVWSSDVQRWFGYAAPSFPGSKLIPAILGTLVFVYGGLVFIRGARRELADHKPGMMTLISLAIVVAFGTSLAASFV